MRIGGRGQIKQLTWLLSLILKHCRQLRGFLDELNYQGPLKIPFKTSRAKATLYFFPGPARHCRRPIIRWVSTSQTFKRKQRKISRGCNEVVFGVFNSGIALLTSGNR